jgi:hypothetical protein
MLERLVGTLVDVVGTTANNRGRSCPRHSCCGSQVVERSTVVFCREQLVFCDQREVLHILYELLLDLRDNA